MEPVSIPERPRLSVTVRARLHVAGDDKKAVLDDGRSGATLELGPSDWRVVQRADGTRDLDGILLASAAAGEQTTEAAVRQLFEELHALGVLEDGLRGKGFDAPVAPSVVPADRPLEVLPDFGLHCDGSGSCCRFYGSVGFLPREALQARVIAPELDLPLSDTELFTPVHGARAEPGDSVAVSQIDGRCAFLGADGLCEIHRRVESSAKPLACQLYPAMAIDDGTAVRISLGPECACIFASVGRSGGAPLVAAAARVAGDIAQDHALMRVPDPVPLGPLSTVGRDVLHDWSRRLHDRLRAGDVGDAAELAWGLASAVETRGLVGPFEGASLDGVGAWLALLRERAEEVATAQDGWRGSSDLSRRVARWLANSLQAHPEPVRQPIDAAAERFYLASLAWGHRLALAGRPLGHGLRDRATRILAARAMASVPGPDDTAAPYPLALLEAAMRNLGISSYADGALP